MSSFRLTKRLNSGSMLTDAWAGSTVTGRPVVVNVRKEPWNKASDFGARYGPIARGWQGLRQPGVVGLVEAGEGNGTVWVVEDFVEGETLRLVLTHTLKEKTPLSVKESAAIGVQLVRGLLALSKVIPPLHHGDVCATNIVVAVDGDVRLSKVGVASCQTADPALGPARAEMFTLAPEELSAPSGSASDVFRLGLVLLECLSSRAVFAGATFAEVKTRVEKYPGLNAKQLATFGGLGELVAAMLMKDPAQRPSLAEVETQLSQLVGDEDPHRLVAPILGRLFKDRPVMLKGLDGSGENLILTPLSSSSTAHTAISGTTLPQVGATNADGSVTLAKMGTKRMTNEEMATVRQAEAIEAARQSAADWAARHANDEGNPRDFALGQQLIEKQRLTVAEADQALQQAQMFNSSFFSALQFFNLMDEDEALPLAADLLRQRCLTGPQLLEQNIGPANASLLPRHVADEFHVLPVRAEGGGLVLAVVDPGNVGVIDSVKRMAKLRSVLAIRATERTITEGLLRVYEGKTSPPEWLQQRRKLTALDPSALPEFRLPMASPPASLDGIEFALPPPPLSPTRAPPVLPPLPDIEFRLGDSPEPPTDVSPLPPSLAQAQALPPLPSAPAPARAPMSSPPMQRPLPAAPPQPQPAPPPSGPNVLDVLSRLFDAVLSLVPTRGPEGAQMVAFVRKVALQSGATGAPLEHVRMCAKAVVVAALIEGKRAFETPSLPAVSAVLGPSWSELEPLLRPLLDQDEAPRGDPRAIVLSLCFGLAGKLNAVPTRLADAKAGLDGLRPGFAPQAIAAVEAVLAK